MRKPSEVLVVLSVPLALIGMLVFLAALPGIFGYLWFIPIFASGISAYTGIALAMVGH